MKTYDITKPLFFLHVPKTGGETLASIFYTWIGKKRLAEAVLSPRQDWPAGSIVTAHYDAVRGREFSKLHPGNQQRMTFLRDPFDQCVSWYFYWKNTWSGKMPTMQGRLPLENYASSLVQFLDTNPFSMLDFLPTMSSFSELDEFLFVGVLERIQACVDSLADILKQPRVEVQSGGKSTKDEPIPAGCRVAFQKSHPKEYEVYDHVVSTWSPIWDAAAAR